MQFSKQNQYQHNPDWYYGIEYLEEMKRGYDYKEDLLVPGHFQLKLTSGDSVIFSASTREEVPGGLKRRYTEEFKKREARSSYKNCLVNSAEQLIIKKDRSTEIVAGLPWFGAWSRDSFISLPGLTLTTGKYKLAGSILDTLVKKMKGGLFPVTGKANSPVYSSSDSPLWFIWSLQEYEKYTDADIWKKYGKSIRSILNAFRKGTHFNIGMHENGLIYADHEGTALTWMDAITVEGPVTRRAGFTVEVNALWYNAVQASLQWAEKGGDDAFVSRWSKLPEKIKKSFLDTFWDEKKGYLADFVNGDEKDFSVRPNMVIAAAMDNNMLSREMKNSVLRVVEDELLTPRGLRTLSPKNHAYRGMYTGDAHSRDMAYHQGAAWPWLLEPFFKAYLDVHKRTGLSLARRIYLGFEDEMINHGIGSVSEVYDGDPPHIPGGAIAQAWSVAALLRINEMIDKFPED